MRYTLKYKIIKRIIIGIEPIGFILLDENGNERQLKEEDVITLCKNNMVTNAEIVLDSDECKYEVVVSDEYKIDNFIKKNKSKQVNVICRIISKDADNKPHCIGYIAKDETGKSYRLDKNKFWKLANNGSINNIKASIIGNNKILISEGNNQLKDLPTIDDI